MAHVCSWPRNFLIPHVQPKKKKKKKDVVHMYNGILFSHKKNEIMPFTAAWMDLEIFILSEIRKRKANAI